ncbi:MAG TPA: hypothetical protein VK821_21305 [Dehalococcoidia bacterium]|nr:hypothetical protein [Dehalococcoidia bacterium]
MCNVEVTNIAGRVARLRRGTREETTDHEQQRGDDTCQGRVSGPPVILRHEIILL